MVMTMVYTSRRFTPSLVERPAVVERDARKAPSPNMRHKSLRLSSFAILALALVGAGGGLSPQEEMEFGVEAARLGLWREALLRWQRAVEAEPRNARMRNNLAVAYESLGQIEQSRVEYKEARRLDPKSKEIRNNYESFLELYKGLEGIDEDEAVRRGGS